MLMSTMRLVMVVTFIDGMECWGVDVGSLLGTLFHFGHDENKLNVST